MIHTPLVLMNGFTHDHWLGKRALMGFGQPRILIIADSLYGWFHPFKSALSKYGFRVLLIKPISFPSLLPAFLKYTHVPTLVSGKLKMQRVKRILEKQNFDAVLNLNFASLYESIPTRQIRVLYYVHSPVGSHPIEFYNPNLYKVVKPYLLWLDRILIGRAKRASILANSHFTLSHYIRHGIKGEVVYYPCQIKGFSPNENKRNLVVSIGRLSPTRGHEWTLAIAKHLPNIRFILFGELADKRYYRRLVRQKPSNLTIVIHASKQLIRDTLSRAKVYLNSCFMETFGVAIIEGMASGCVPIVRNYGAPAETVTEDVGFRWDSIEEAVTYIREVLEEGGLRRTKSANAVKRAELFTPQRFELRLMTALRNLGVLEC